ncbi:MAG: glutamate 5-kinase [Kiritimatiellae bacterium]|nr:glutamate 5-kinase [Kiritimatiellia bacterium]
MSVSIKERAALQDARRVVVKVGTHAIAKATGRPDYAALRRLVSQIAELRESGFEVVFVSSGAVAAGVEALGLSARPKQVNDVQMCAAVGQARFIYEYEKLFAAKGIQIGQVLLTHADFDDTRRAVNLRRSLDRLMKAGIIPVVNENDFVADDELKGLTFGDNDWLASLIAKLIHADALILLTTVDGLLDGEGKRVSSFTKIKDALKLVREGQKGSLSKGGMDSKLKATKNAASAGINVIIANGRKKVLQGIMSGRDVGTFFPGTVV